MKSSIDRLLGKIETLERELEAVFAVKRAEFAYRFENRKIVFEAELLRRHRELKVGLLEYIKGVRLLVLLTAPFIYVLIIPLALLDLLVSLYQAICFPIYGVPKVHRRDFIVLDRHKLAYLNLVEKINCSYCSYANGLIAYVREIASRTEKYWCPIKHARKVEGTHRHYPEFSDYGDAETYRRFVDRSGGPDR